MDRLRPHIFAPVAGPGWDIMLWLFWAIQFAVIKFLVTGSQVPLFAAITLRIQKPLSNSSEGLFEIKFI
jgi:hypothetical protein